VHDALAMAKCDHLHEMAEEHGSLVLGEEATLLEAMEELPACAELHDEVHEVVVLVHRLEVNDVGVAREARHDLDLEPDAPDVVGGHEAVLGDGLAGEVLAGDQVGAGPDDAELAPPELRAERVAVLEARDVRRLQDGAAQSRRLVRVVLGVDALPSAATAAGHRQEVVPTRWNPTNLPPPPPPLPNAKPQQKSFRENREPPRGLGGTLATSATEFKIPTAAVEPGRAGRAPAQIEARLGSERPEEAPHSASRKTGGGTGESDSPTLLPRLRRASGVAGGIRAPAQRGRGGCSRGWSVPLVGRPTCFFLSDIAGV
jgi:hypothetical protein